MAEITHFFHEHPLILRKGFPKYNVDGYGNFCYVCHPKSSHGGAESSDGGAEKEGEYADAYVCEICKEFFLHKSCAELPRDIIHKSLHKHSLVLSNISNKLADADAYACEICNKFLVTSSNVHSLVVYTCYKCEFALHIECAFKEKKFVIYYDENDCTKICRLKDHSMRLFPRPARVHCDACDVKKEDFFYHCLSCIYQIHRSCALLQSTTKREDHKHTLTLSIGLPSLYHDLDFYCHVCKDKLDKREKNWLYYCKLCRYFVHIKCMESETDDTIYGTPEPGMISFPMADKSKDLIQRFLLGNKEFVDIPQERPIFSHKHPLILSNEQITEEDDEEILCDGCIEPISSPPYYHCVQCRYFLHLPCANLPRNFRDPIRHTLFTLGSKSRFYDDFTCHMCSRISNGFYFGCEFHGNHIYLDVKCAALMTLHLTNKKIIHESHLHPMYIRHKNDPVYPSDHLKFYLNCNACNDSTNTKDTLFACVFCRIQFHYDCFMLPKTTRHRFDSNHPLILKYPPHDYHERPFDCAECEKEIHPSFWLFHCEECDLSFHLKCINPALGRYKFGQKLRIASHSHPLKFVMEASVRSPCHQCGVDIRLDLAFECETCNFHLCRKCVKNIELMS